MPYPASDATARPEAVASWIVQTDSGGLEAVRASARGRSERLTRVESSLVLLGALVLSLTPARRGLSIGTAYAVRVGIGAVLTVVRAIATGQEPVSVATVVGRVMIVGGVVGLELAH